VETSKLLGLYLIWFFWYRRISRVCGLSTYGSKNFRTKIISHTLYIIL